MMPGNPRYQPPSLVPYFGYDNLYRFLGRVEIANLQVLGELGVIPPDEIALLTPELIARVLAITTTEVDEIENQITKHDVRAWVRVAQGLMDPKLARWVHIPLTSYDPLDTGRSLQFLSAYHEAVRPAIVEVIEMMITLVRRYADTLQIGRTHGQHALPITVGFWLATILSRMSYALEKLDQHASELVGKVSGAVGASNAIFGLGIAEQCGEYNYEERVLHRLGLPPALISTQILPPEPLAQFLHSCVLMSAALGQFGRDARQLMRNEIREVAEGFAAGQVGSSTMAHKRNPINFEKLEGTWLRSKSEFGKVLDTLLSDHQRDLVGSSVMRDLPIIVINLQVQLDTLLRRDQNGLAFLERVTVDEGACRANFELSVGVILAEPAYIALQMAGYPGDAHELVNRELMPEAFRTGLSLAELLEQKSERDPELGLVYAKIPTRVRDLLDRPEYYTGNAADKARQIADLAEAQLT